MLALEPETCYSIRVFPFPSFGSGSFFKKKLPKGYFKVKQKDQGLWKFVSRCSLREDPLGLKEER